MKKNRAKNEKKNSEEKLNTAEGEEMNGEVKKEEDKTKGEKIEVEHTPGKEEATEESEQKAINDFVKSYEEELSVMMEKINELENEKNELNDMLLRRSADFENYKKRSENEQMNLLKFAAEPFIIKVLSVYDDLSRALGHIGVESNLESLSKGFQLIFDKFTKVLDEQGVKKIDAKGKQFDFNYHEALMQKVSNDVPPHTIIEEVEPGYIYKDKVIRHAKVIVSQQTSDNEAQISPEREEKTDNDNNKEN